MSPIMSSEIENLKNLILKQDAKIVDKTGRTKLIEKAQNNSELEPLSPEKKFQEEVVCNLVRSFKDFDQISFSELESYILTSNFSQNRIVESFIEFVFQKDKSEDLILKACVARSIQHLRKTAFTYDYIKDRFSKIVDRDPWLYVELVIACNWQKGVEEISNQLRRNYDSSYLFSLLPEWINTENSKQDVSEAFSLWYPLFNEHDKKLVEYYAENYGYKIKGQSNSHDKINSAIITTLTNSSAFTKFLENPIRPNYKTLHTSC